MFPRLACAPGWLNSTGSGDDYDLSLSRFSCHRRPSVQDRALQMELTRRLSIVVFVEGKPQ